jgi:hypothetical protein
MSLDKALRAAVGEHYAPGQLHSPVSTLALDFEMHLAQSLPLLVVVLGLGFGPSPFA